MSTDKQRQTQSRRLFWAALGSVLGLVLLYAATRQVDMRPLLVTLHSSNPLWAIGVLLSTAGFVAIKALRWSMLLRFVPRRSFAQLQAAVYIGLAVNFLLAQAGEFLRAATFARRNHVSVSAVVATVLVERALDFLALLLLLASLSFFVSDLPSYIETALLVSGGIAAFGVLCLYALLHTPGWVLRLVTRLARPLPERIKAWSMNQFTLSRTGLIAIRDLRRMILALAVSVLQWLLVMTAIWSSVESIGETATVVPVAATFVLIIIGQMLPNSPMQVGTTQLAFTIGLGTGGIMATAAIAASLIYMLLLILPIMIAGGVSQLYMRQTRDHRES